jgi:uncharacterized protein (DUF983 family)
MSKMIIAFVSFTVLFAAVIVIFRELTQKERWHLTKWLGLSILCSVLAVITLSAIVFIF